MLSNDAILRIARLLFADKTLQCLPIESTWVPFARLIRLACCDVKLPIHACNSTITKERQRLSIGKLFISRQEGTRISNRQKSRHCPTTGFCQYLAFTIAFVSNG